jgi:diguanylate cyclase (GGDEF)-like protein
MRWIQTSSETVEKEFLQRRIETCRQAALRGFAATPLSAPAIALVLRPFAPTNELVVWAVAAVVVGLIVLALTFWHRQIFGDTLWTFGIGSFLIGLVWAGLPWSLHPTDAVAQSIILMVIVSIGAVGTTVTAPNRISFHSVCTPLFFLGGGHVMWQADDRIRNLLPLMIPTYLVFAVVHGEIHKGMMNTLGACIRNEQLVAELELERLHIEDTNGALTQANEQLTYRTSHDPMTGLLNRVGLAEVLDNLNRSARPGAGVAIIFLDLDGFKLVNDSLGHAFGDRLLRATAERCLEAHGNSVFARLGGDEFCAVVAGVPSVDMARSAAERLRVALTRPIRIDGREITVTGSFGVAVGYGDVAVDDLRRSADVALYRAKAAGRNQVVVFDQIMQISLSQIATKGSEIREAFQAGKVRPWFQPKIDLFTGRIVAAEALARWIDGDDVRTAGEFMGIAHEVGLGPQISNKIVHNVIRARGVQHRNGLAPDFRYWMNVTPQQLSDNAHLVAFLSHMERFGAPGIGLGIEVTENDLIRDFGQATYALSTLRDHGVAVALDDFGTGHSSLSLLQRLPLDNVKIDRSFVRDLETDPRDKALARTIISLAHELDLTVTAEGVENGKQADILREMGCDFAQGFLYSKAVPEEHLLGKIKVQSANV